MEQNELNKVALELAIKSLDNKKNENKNVIIAFIVCIILMLISFSFIVYLNNKRIDKVVDLLQNRTEETIDIDYGDGEFNGNATLGDGNIYGQNKNN